MRYKEFEIRPVALGTNIIPNKWEVIKWRYEDSCFTIAFLDYDPKQPGFEFRSVGTRYLEYADLKLNKIILKWCEMQELILGEEE